jgi:GNAT superfamily N-acetyltransferase
MSAGAYSVAESLRDGRVIEVRALRPSDRANLLAAIDGSSAESRYRRFFSPKRGFSEREITYFLEVDFVTHVALVAVVESGAIVGGARYIVGAPGQAEVAVFVVDRHQGQGVGEALMRHLVTIGRGAGLNELSADVLADNTAMIRVFEKSRFPVTSSPDGSVVHLAMRLR